LVAQRTRDYELVMVLSPQASDEEVSATTQRVADLITTRGGSVLEQKQMGLRRLAFPIKRFQEGNYFLTRFTSNPNTVMELDRSLKASEDILRHMLTKA